MHTSSICVPASGIPKDSSPSEPFSSVMAINMPPNTPLSRSNKNQQQKHQIMSRFHLANNSNTCYQTMKFKSNGVQLGSPSYGSSQLISTTAAHPIYMQEVGSTTRTYCTSVLQPERLDEVHYSSSSSGQYKTMTSSCLSLQPSQIQIENNSALDYVNTVEFTSASMIPTKMDGMMPNGNISYTRQPMELVPHASMMPSVLISSESVTSSSPRPESLNHTSPQTDGEECDQVDSDQDEDLFPDNSEMREMVKQLFRGIHDPTSRVQSISELCKRCDIIPGIGTILWRKKSVIQVFLYEIVGLYPLLHPPRITMEAYELICCIVALLQRMVLEKEVREEFLSSGVLFFLLPFLMLDGTSRDTEHLRVCLLSFLATIVQKMPIDKLEVLFELSNSDVYAKTVSALSRCLSEVGKSMALLVLYRLLQSKLLLEFISDSKARFSDVVLSLSSATTALARRLGTSPQVLDRQRKLMLYIIRCFSSLAQHPLLREALCGTLPRELTGYTLCNFFRCPQIERCLCELWSQLDSRPVLPPGTKVFRDEINRMEFRHL